MSQNINQAMDDVAKDTLQTFAEMIKGKLVGDTPFSNKALVTFFIESGELLLGVAATSDGNLITIAIQIEEKSGRVMTYSTVYDIAKDAYQQPQFVRMSPSTVGGLARFTDFLVDQTTAGTAGDWGSPKTIDMPAPPPAPTAFSFNGYAPDGVANINVGDTLQLEVSPSPSYPIRWQSSNVQKAEVDSNGVVTAVSAGSTNITAGPFRDGVAQYITLCVSLDEAVYRTLVEEYVEIRMGEVYTIPIAPSAPVEDPTGWSSDTPSVATVDAYGKITAVAMGTAIITGYGVTQYVTVLSVTGEEPPPFWNAEVLISGDGYGIVGNPDNITATAHVNEGVLPVGETLTWSSLDEAIATINPTTGALAFISNGFAQIKGTYSPSGKEISAGIHVYPALDSTHHFTNGAGDITPRYVGVVNHTLQTHIAPALGVGDSVVYLMPNTNYGDIDTSGVISPSGNTTAAVPVIAFITIGGVTKTVRSYLDIILSGHTWLLTESPVVMGNNTTKDIGTIDQYLPTDTDYNWSSSDAGVVTVTSAGSLNHSGRLASHAAGSATVFLNFIGGPLDELQVPVAVTVTP